jgi:hypothetical protein
VHHHLQLWAAYVVLRGFCVSKCPCVLPGPRQRTGSRNGQAAWDYLPCAGLLLVSVVLVWSAWMCSSGFIIATGLVSCLPRRLFGANICFGGCETLICNHPCRYATLKILGTMFCHVRPHLNTFQARLLQVGRLLTHTPVWQSLTSYPTS